MRIDKFNKLRLKSDKWKKIFKNKKVLVSVLMVLLVLGLSIGYSALASNLNITGIVTKVRLKSDIRITSFSISSVSNATSNYSEYNKQSVSMGISLPDEDSTATYKVTVTNIGNVEMGLFDITGLPSNLEYTLTDLELEQKICNDDGQCKNGITKDFYITIKYVAGEYDSSSTTYDINLDFDFQEVSDYICIPVTEGTKTYGNVPEGNYEAGDEYICQVSDTEEYHFFVTTSTNDNVSLLMEQNLDSIGTVAWITEEDFTASAQNDSDLDMDLETIINDYYSDYFDNYGPVTALNALKTYTKQNKWIVTTTLPSIEEFATAKEVILDDLNAMYVYIPTWSNINLTNSNFSGYWTKESVNSSSNYYGGVVVNEYNEYQAGYDGWYEYAYILPDNSDSYGIRPLITVPKTSMQPPSEISTGDSTGGKTCVEWEYVCAEENQMADTHVSCGTIPNYFTSTAAPEERYGEILPGSEYWEAYSYYEYGSQSQANYLTYELACNDAYGNPDEDGWTCDAVLTCIYNEGCAVDYTKQCTRYE